MRTGFGRNKVPHPSSYPRPLRLHLIQPCLTSIPAVQYSLICHVLNANFNVLPPHMLWKGESATVMLWLLSNPQLNKHRGHLQVGRHRDVCLSRRSTSLPSLQLTPYLSNAEGKRDLTTATSLRNPPCAPPPKLPQLAKTVSPRVVIWSCERADVKNKVGKNCVKLSRTFY